MTFNVSWGETCEFMSSLSPSRVSLWQRVNWKQAQSRSNQLVPPNRKQQQQVLGFEGFTDSSFWIWSRLPHLWATYALLRLLYSQLTRSSTHWNNALLLLQSFDSMQNTDPMLLSDAFISVWMCVWMLDNKHWTVWKVWAWMGPVV